MNPSIARFAAAMTAVAALCGCVSADQTLPPPPLHPNGQALWTIVHDKCMPDETEHALPAPCAAVTLVADPALGFAVLKDRNGVAQHLLMPTTLITGIEDPKILAPDAQNFFSEAWEASSFVRARLDRPLPRGLTSIAVNSIYGRSQDLLHLHIDCLDPSVRTSLDAGVERITERWSPDVLVLKGQPYRARWISGNTLSLDPFRLLAQEVPGAAQTMGAWTLVLIGETSPSRGPGFLLLAGKADPAKGLRASGEDLQDHSCRGVSPA